MENEKIKEINKQIIIKLKEVQDLYDTKTKILLDEYKQYYLGKCIEYIKHDRKHYLFVREITQKNEILEFIGCGFESNFDDYADKTWFKWKQMKVEDFQESLFVINEYQIKEITQEQFLNELHNATNKLFEDMNDINCFTIWQD